MYNSTFWKDHAVTPANTYTLTENPNGTVTLIPAGTVVQQGTNMNAANFNNMEAGIMAAYATAVEAMNVLRLANDKNSKHDDDIAQIRTSIAELTADTAKQVHFVDVGMLEAARVAMLAYQKAESIEGFVMTATLTNTKKYPFNNSVQTLAIPQTSTRTTKDYTVTVEVTDYSGGCVGDIVVSDKMLNGFKVAHTGSATSVSLKIYVQGGG